MTANRPIEAVKKFVRDLQLEHYDLLHKHGYADYRLDEEPVEGYTEDALHLTELYERDLTLLLRQELRDELIALRTNRDNLPVDIYERIVRRIDELEPPANPVELTNTQEGKDKHE
jgi:hypothetical protein